MPSHQEPECSNPSLDTVSCRAHEALQNAPPHRDERLRPAERVVAALRRQGRKVAQHGEAWTAQCPAHDDRRASLSIREGRKGQALLKCHAGCQWRDIAAALGLEVGELFASDRLPDRSSPSADVQYDYRDRAGVLLYQVVRTPEKRFWVRRPAGSGGWVKGLGDAARVPYRLPELLAAAPEQLVFVPEGEKDVDALRARGLVASTNVFGAGCWRDEYSAWFQGRRVVALPDNDAPGREHAEAVVASLRRAGVEAALLALPGLPAKGDVSDWLQAGGQPAQLVALGEQALAKAWAAVDELLNTKTRRREDPAGLTGKTVADSDPTVEDGRSSVSPCLRGENESIPAARMPEPLAPPAYHGIVGEIVRAIEPYTEAHPAALLLTLLTALGNLIGPHPYARVGPTRHFLKLFVVIFGPTAKGRKGTSEDHVRALLREVDPEWEPSRLLSGVGSGEGIIHHVRDPVEAEETEPKTGVTTRILKDEGVRDKRLLIIESEFAQLLKVMSREGNTVSPIVRNAWDDKPLQNATKHSPAIATGSHVSLLGHSTQEELLRYLTRTEAANGFANRFLWAWSVRSKALPFPQQAPGLPAFATRLRAIVARARRIGEIDWGPLTRSLWAAVYPQLSEGRSGMFGAVTSRAEAQVLRLSTLYAVLDGSATIEPPHLLAGLAVWRYCEASARYLFGDATGDPAADAILEKVRQSPAGIARGEIRDLLQRHCSRERLTQLLERLAAEGLIRREKRADTGGRPAELLFPTDSTLPGAEDSLALALRLAREAFPAEMERWEAPEGGPADGEEYAATCDISAESAETPPVHALSALSAHPTDLTHAAAGCEAAAPLSGGSGAGESALPSDEPSPILDPDDDLDFPSLEGTDDSWLEAEDGEWVHAEF